MGEDDERIGSLVDGRYKVLEAMASGSMGAVYKAERVPVGKLVAIKFLHAAFANDSEFLTRVSRTPTACRSSTSASSRASRIW